MLDRKTTANDNPPVGTERIIRRKNRTGTSFSSGVSRAAQRGVAMREFSGSASGFSIPSRKPKLGAPNDPAERAADATADRVMRFMSGDRSNRQPQNNAREDHNKTRSSNALTSGVVHTPRFADEMTGDGAPLSENTRRPFEQAFRKNLKGIRVHTDARADRLNQKFDSRAFALDSHIFFSRGEYQPHTREGQSVLAHEIAHTQQPESAGVIRRMDPPGKAPAKINYNVDDYFDDLGISGDDDDSDDDSDDPDYEDSHEYAIDIPKNVDQKHTIDGKNYKFHNDAVGCLDFGAPVAPGTAVTIEADVNINNGDKIKGFPDKNLKQPKNRNYWHFKAANMLEFKSNSGTSPDGKTWHHHKDKGRMQLLDREIHATFKHKGGKSIWGTG